MGMRIRMASGAGVLPVLSGAGDVFPVDSAHAEGVVAGDVSGASCLFEPGVYVLHQQLGVHVAADVGGLPKSESVSGFRLGAQEGGCRVIAGEIAELALQGLPGLIGMAHGLFCGCQSLEVPLAYWPESSSVWALRAASWGRFQGGHRWRRIRPGRESGRYWGAWVFRRGTC